MSDAHGVARDQLRAFIERIERLEEEKKTIADDIKDVYGEAKSMGFDTKILRKVISIRKQDADERAEQEAILDSYLHALGMIQMDMFDEPEPEAETSPKLVATVATAMQTQAGRAALLTAVDIMIEREERIDPTTGEFLDARPRSDAGLDIVTKHTEIATNEGGANQDSVDMAQGSTPDLEPSGPEAERATHSPEEANEVPAQDGGGTGPGESLSGKSNAARPASVDAQPNGRGSAGQAEESVVTVVGTESGTVAPFTFKPPSPLRPHCRQPEACGGYGRNHCHTCAKALREREPTEELA